MRRMRVIALAIVGAFALVAVAASGAQATEYGQCVEQKKGNFADGNCQTVAANKRGEPTHKGHFEWRPGPPPSCVRLARKQGQYADAGCTTLAKRAGKGAYETAPGPGFTSQAFNSTIATATLSNTVECSKEVSAGEVTGLKSAVETITLTGCRTHNEAALACTSEGAASGTIKTLPVETTLIGNGEHGPSGKEPAPGEVWTELAGTAANTGMIAQFDCLSSGNYRMTGSMSGVTVQDVNEMSKVAVTAFEEGHGEQDLMSEFSPSGTTWLGPYASVWHAKGPTEYASSLEIKTP
jgi:hypothetical protein